VLLLTRKLNGYLIGCLTPKINIHLMAYKKKIDSSKMSTVKNPTFTFDLTQIQVVKRTYGKVVRKHKMDSYIVG
jgi:hypothetical protein